MFNSERFEITNGFDNNYLIEDYETGNDYSVEQDGNIYICIDNFDNCIEQWNRKPTIEQVIEAINIWNRPFCISNK